MSIFASFLRGAYKLSGAKKAFALPEDQTPSVQIVLPMTACSNDQPVNIAFRDKGDFNDLLSSIPILIHLLNDPLTFR